MTGLFLVSAKHCLNKPFSRVSDRFAEIEATVALSMLIRKYRITVTEDPKFAGETFEQRSARILKVCTLVTSTPEKVPVTFTLRG